MIGLKNLDASITPIKMKINPTNISIGINIILLLIIGFMWYSTSSEPDIHYYDKEIKKLYIETKSLEKDNLRLVSEKISIETRLNETYEIIDSLNNEITIIDKSLHRNEDKANDFINGNRTIVADSAVIFFTDYIKRTREKRSPSNDD